MPFDDIFSTNAKEVISTAFSMAGTLGHTFVGSEHILLALSVDNSIAGDILRENGINQSFATELVSKYHGRGNATFNGGISITPDAGMIFQFSEKIASKNNEDVYPEHLLSAILKEKQCIAYKLLISAGAPVDQMVNDLSAGNISGERSTSGKGSTSTETLDKYSIDLTKMAKEDALDPVVNRDDEIQRVVQILSRRTKNNPCLIGEPGVGKTAIAEGLAQRIVSGDVPEGLLGKRLLSLDLASLVAGTKFRGEFEERIKAYIDEAKACKNVVLFIDELHTLIGAGAGEGSMDAANILKPALSRGEVQVIGATTLNEYRKHIEKDAALERRFQSIMVLEPTPEQSVEILKGLREKYEEHHSLKIPDETIDCAVNLSFRYIQDRFLPDKAIDLVDEAASRVRTLNRRAPSFLKDYEKRMEALENEKRAAISAQDFEQAAYFRDKQGELENELETQRKSYDSTGAGEVTPEDIAAVVSSWTGIPVTTLTEDEGAKLMRLEGALHQRVIGQNEAVTAVSKAVRRSRVGLKDPKRPVGSFLFLGPTGVGKTELCKTLAETLFGDEQAMIRVDMSEFMEKHTVSKLIGSPPGYVGYDEGGQLTEKVRRKPYSVILFDEIEKAHMDVWNILLQIMDDGHITDAMGRRVDFKNSIIVMTSNLGAVSLFDKPKTLGFSAEISQKSAPSYEDVKKNVMAEVKKAFRPEFINRIDEIIVFHSLEQEDVGKIAELMLAETKNRMSEIGLNLEYSKAVVDYLAEKGFDSAYGARPLRRLIRREIEDRAAELLLEHGSKSVDLLVNVTDDELTVSVNQSVSHKNPLPSLA